MAITGKGNRKTSGGRSHKQDTRGNRALSTSRIREQISWRVSCFVSRLVMGTFTRNNLNELTKVSEYSADAKMVFHQFPDTIARMRAEIDADAAMALFKASGASSKPKFTRKAA